MLSIVEPEVAEARIAEPKYGIANEDDLDERLSRPTQALIEMFRRLPGDILVLGVGGKMGPTLARMGRRAADACGQSSRRIIGVARFTNPRHEAQLRRHGVETFRCDLLDRAEVETLPDVPNVIYMAGRKFGTSEAPELTWAMNTIMPAIVAEKYQVSRIVVFSTGCVYPNVPVASGGSCEDDPTTPEGEYAYSCIGREQVFRHYSRQNGTPIALFRLNYAIDLRYGVLLDIALKVKNGAPIDLTMGNANVIWQGDANAQAFQCLEHAATPPFVINVTGPETISVRQVARRFGELLDRTPTFAGDEAPTALLSNASQAHRLFGYPTVSLDQMLEWTAGWIKQNGSLMGLPTHFEVRDGKY